MLCFSFSVAFFFVKKLTFDQLICEKKIVDCGDDFGGCQVVIQMIKSLMWSLAKAKDMLMTTSPLLPYLTFLMLKVAAALRVGC